MTGKQITENLVILIWQNQIVNDLFTDMGEHVQVIFPGRVCTNGGCDLQDAVFVIEGEVMVGNIEVHVKSSYWYRHGHNKDSRYNDILLHVVMWHDCLSDTVLQNGKVIPTISLSAFLAYPLSSLNGRVKLRRRRLFACPAIDRHLAGKSLVELLNATGKERFNIKAALIREDLIEQNAGQVLFRNISRALGYDKNTVPFETLAHKLTLRALEELKNKEDIFYRAFILGTAGLLVSQRLRVNQKSLCDPEIEQLETIWRSSSIATTMNQLNWCFFRVRPNNFPTRRLVALGYLVARYFQTGLLQGILNLVRRAYVEKVYSCIEGGLIVFRQGYWANHSDFGMVMPRNIALLGKSKAAEIIINVLLPFAYAWGELVDELDLKDNAIKLYFGYPGLEDNQLTRFMRQQFSLNKDFRLSAAQQQGLIHIFKTYCRYRNCQECPVSVRRG